MGEFWIWASLHQGVGEWSSVQNPDRLLEDSRPKPMVSVCRESSPDDGTSSFAVLPIASPTISTSPRPSEAPSLCCLMCDGMVAGKKRKCRIWGASDPTSEMLIVSMSTLLEANSTSRTWNSGVRSICGLKLQ
jgi:hypothetical protein